MVFKSDIYRVLIASPSDLPDERRVATDAVNDWSALHSEAEGIVLLPVKWETHATPESGVRPQEAINRQFVRDCDILIGMFWTKLGTKTGVAESGTVEEIGEFVKAGKPAMLYFSSRPIDPTKIDIDQHQKLKQFKEETFKTALAGSFADLNELKATLQKDLTVIIRRLRKSARPDVGVGGHAQTSIVTNNRSQADKIRVEFETTLVEGKFRGFVHMRGILAMAVIPVAEVDPPLAFDRNFRLRHGDTLRPMRTDHSEFDTDVHSIITLNRPSDNEAIEGIVELTDRGRILLADHWGFSNEKVGWLDEPVLFYMNDLEPEILRTVYRYLDLSGELGIRGPWYVGISLLKAKGYRLAPNKRMIEKQLKRPLSTDTISPDLTEIPTEYKSLDQHAFARLFRRSLNQFWQGFGWDDARFFDESGRYTAIL